MEQLKSRMENDFVIRESENLLTDEEKITFKHQPKTFIKHDYDWYIIVAIEKADKVKTDRHLLTSELLLQYRWAIREGYNHQLDPNLENRFDYPRNQNTIKGIEGYIDLIKKRSDEEMNFLCTIKI